MANSSHASIARIHTVTGGVVPTVDELLKSLAAARGCKTDEEIAEFLSPSPELKNPMLGLVDFNKGIDRVIRAIRDKENISVFGDYDCDGVTSSAQCINLLRAAKHSNFRVYIPDRFIEDYGLTMDAVQRCADDQKPSVIIAVDCGSSAKESLIYLKERGIDVIVLDHHQVHLDGVHPAFAHMNPKGDPGFATDPVIQDAARMSAAGLAFFFCDEVSNRGGFNWDRDANLILGGLGTYVDVMPMIGINRALVKHAIRLCNSDTVHRVPGIVELLKASKFDKAVTEHTFGFIIGPCFNAAGRLAHAKASLSLACAQTTATAEERAKALVEQNNERKSIQENILKEATQQAEAIMAAAPDTKVLILYGRDWHTGVVGIVAGRIKEQFHRPTIVMARLDTGYWKGSGRSIHSIDIGSFVTRAVKEGALTSGGGHAMACGVKLRDDQIADFISWVKVNSKSLSDDLAPKLEVIGNVEYLVPDKWVCFFERGAPFGQGNPRPHIFIERPGHKWGPEPAYRQDRVTVWGVKAGLKSESGTSLVVTHTNLPQGMALFAPDTSTRLVLDFTRTFGKNGAVYDNWRVVHGEIIHEEIKRNVA